jgi:hypothetical protein
MVRIAQRLNALEFVEQSDTEKLPTFKEMSTVARKMTANTSIGVIKDHK